MTTTYTLHGWQASFFTGKVRSYLQFKGIPFVENAPTLFNYYVSLRRKTGVVAIPVLRTPQGQWLQDSSDIIDHLEAHVGAVPVLPATPVQRFAAYLFELWCDELWIPTALATRWCHMPENYPFLEHDVARNLLPGWPLWLQKKAAAKVAKHMYSYLPLAGVVPEQFDMLDRWTARQLGALDRHFEQHPFLFGTRPSLGDFALMGPLYGHLSRDPWPAQHLMAPHRHVAAWIARMSRVQPPAGEFLADDKLPATLEPLITTVLGELLAYLEGVARVAQPALARAGTLPRFMDEVEIPMGEGRYRRPAMPYGLWMLQRLRDDWRAMSLVDSEVVREWLAGHGAERLLDIELPRLRRDGLQVVVERPTAPAACDP